LLQPQIKLSVQPEKSDGEATTTPLLAPLPTSERVEAPAKEVWGKPRIHNIAVEMSQFKDELDVNINGFNVDSRSKELSVKYSRNFGNFQPGFLIGLSKESSGTKVKVNTGLLFARLNFIENVAPNDLIPFAGIGYGKRQEDFKASDNSFDFLLSGDVTLMALGLNWYPFSELFAFEVLLGQWEAKYDYSGEPDVDVDVDFKREFFSIGAVLSF